MNPVVARGVAGPHAFWPSKDTLTTRRGGLRRRPPVRSRLRRYELAEIQGRGRLRSTPSGRINELLSNNLPTGAADDFAEYGMKWSRESLTPDRRLTA